MPGLRTLAVAGAALIESFRPRLIKESLRVLGLVLLQALIRPLLFYLTVAILLGITVPYVVVHISLALRPSVLLSMIGGAYILALAPPLSAIVFAATSGSAINAWLGGLELRGQVLALRGLGIRAERYLWSPAWLGLVLSYLIVAALFVVAMIGGGYLLFDFYQVPRAFEVLSGDFLTPAPERESYLVRGYWLVVAYGLAIASIAVATGSAAKRRMSEVTRSMTSSVMRITLLVVVVELASIGLLYGLEGR